MMSTGPALIFRELHRLRRHAKELQDQIERVPRQQKIQNDKAARHEQIFREAQEHLKKLKVQIHEKEVSLKTTHAQIEKHSRQLNQAAGNKEYDALKTEIAHEREAAAKLEEQAFALMTEVEEQTARLPELEKAVKAAKEEAAAFGRESQTRQAGLAEMLQKTLAELAEVEKNIPADARLFYDRLVTARGEDALASAANRTCNACYTELTAQMYNDLLSGRVVPCKTCGRLLYLPEG